MQNLTQQLKMKSPKMFSNMDTFQIDTPAHLYNGRVVLAQVERLSARNFKEAVEEVQDIFNRILSENKLWFPYMLAEHSDKNGVYYTMRYGVLEKD